MLPRAAEAFRRQITLGLDKDSRAAGKARVILRKLLGTINLRPGPDKSLWAEYELSPSALLKSAGIAGTEGTTGSGGVIAFTASPFSYVGRLRQPRGALFLQSAHAFTG